MAATPKRKKQRKFHLTIPLLFCLLIIGAALYLSMHIGGDNNESGGGLFDFSAGGNEEMSDNSANQKKGKNIVIDAGHGGLETPGCSYEDADEGVLNLKIALLLEEVLTKQGYQVSMVRREDVSVSLSERSKLANRNDLLISIHQNAQDDGTDVHGIETWYHPTVNKSSVRLATCIQEAVIAASKAKDRGLKPTRELIITRDTTVPSCLIETGFLSNKEERQLLLTKAYQQKLAEGIAQGINDYYSK